MGRFRSITNFHLSPMQMSSPETAKCTGKTLRQNLAVYDGHLSQLLQPWTSISPATTQYIIRGINTSKITLIIWGTNTSKTTLMLALPVWHESSFMNRYSFSLHEIFAVFWDYFPQQIPVAFFITGGNHSCRKKCNECRDIQHALTILMYLKYLSV